MYSDISEKIPVLKSLCEKYLVESLYLFGSAVEDYSESYFALQCQLRVLFNREIDLITFRFLSNPYFIQSTEESKELVCAA